MSGPIRGPGGSRPSFRAAAAQRLAEDGGALPPAIEEFLSDTRQMVVRMLPVRLVHLRRDRVAAVVDGLALEPLVASVRQFGVLEPLLVRPAANGAYEVIAGERRLHAARLAGLETIPVVVREMDDSIVATLFEARSEMTPAVNGARPEETRPRIAVSQPDEPAEPARPVERPRHIEVLHPVESWRARRATNGTYMPPAVVARRVPRVISGPGIPGPTSIGRDGHQPPSPIEERAIAGGDPRSTFRFGPFLFQRRARGSGDHR